MLLADLQNQLPLEYPLEELSWISEFRQGIIDPIIPDKGRDASTVYNKSSKRM